MFQASSWKVGILTEKNRKPNKQSKKLIKKHRKVCLGNSTRFREIHIMEAKNGWVKKLTFQ